MTNNSISIGINGSMLDEQPTGVGVYSFNLINNLSKLYGDGLSGKLTVFTPTTSLLNANLKTIKLSNLLQSSRYGKIAAFCRFIWNTFYYPIQGRGFDLLISPTTHGSFLLQNQVITIHDLLSLRYNNISPHQRFYFRWLLPFLVKRARLIIAVSETTKKDIIHFLKCPEEKISVVYNGYDTALYFRKEENRNFIFHEYGVSNYLLAVGPTYPHKNFERLLLAYNRLDDELKSEYPLVIAGGKKKYTDGLKEIAKKLKLENHVHFIGYVPIDLMPSLYREAIGLVFPSLFEGFGIPLLEAMACGCPVVVSESSSMPEVCGDAALYFDPLDIKDITEAIKKIIAGIDLRQELREKGLKRAQRFSWQQTAVAYKAIIEQKFSPYNN